MLGKVLKRDRPAAGSFCTAWLYPEQMLHSCQKRMHDSEDLFRSFNLKYIGYKKKMTCVVSSAFPQSPRPFRRAFAMLVIFFHIHLTGLTCLENHENTDVIAFRQH